MIRSYDRHDYVEVNEDGEKYMVDGGMDYLRRSLTGEECSIFADDPFEIVRDYLVWRTYGKHGDEPFRWIALSEMEDGHIEAIIKVQSSNNSQTRWYTNLMKQELKFREITRDK